MTAPSEMAIRAAGTALARAEIFDDRVTADTARIQAWAEAMEPHGLDQADAIAAVTAHYSAPGATTVRVGDVITAARKIRRERAEREKGEQVAIAAPDGQLGGLPIGDADGTPIWPAYEQHDAITVPCRTCQAQPDEACVNLATQMTRKIPCTTRITDGMKASRA
ncbi:hypothetical protein PP487_gp73 [Gordonia phage Herod]|uniref:Uncharacterized protein n=5 Tax=Nymphadoravirus TaxID=2169636 RepID=A0A142KAU9_9CAUD|nr:hypothetical protein SEA_NYMPHADORA_73 [Gordonia phage Nymphadora]YP_010652938.1 hypothetical protein PP487_gp73 [Gordonia phage Herod]AOE43881.1 hypothetical protein SEA_BATSTARR_72 [Gordonia phage BatStarr]QDP43352.1 hypothetical protein SEA_EVIARTO_73 [Gordonia phage Eviarto]QDP43432.1 hypothetical protein SEA_TIMTAM_73 [Gordonia phage TimTam]AMS03232.1 hypothetical protein SEA_NYMPHADORA_73 [Gordonia phage Nymphadora]QOP67374.1 hypothetical protein SEA_HEROD_73 [Gordonia phage Herod]